MKDKKFNFSGIVAFLLAVLVLAVFVPVNLIADMKDKVYDLTPAKQYTLNSKTKDLLKETSDKHIDIYLLLESLQLVKDDPDTLALYHTLSELKSRDNITLTCFDPDKDPELTKSLDPTGTLTTSRGDIFVKCGEVIKRVPEKWVYQYTEYAGNRLRVYAGEELIAGAIKVCTSGSLPTMYFLTGHGEKTIDDSYAYFARTLRTDNYSTESLDLDEAGAIPGNTAAIWLIGPQTDITEKERDLLLSFIDNGGSVSMLIGPCETEGRFRNIEKVLSTSGIEMDYNFVTDTNPTNQLPDHNDVQNPAYFRVMYPYATDDFTQDLTTQLNERVNEGMTTAAIFNTRSFGQLPDDQYNSANYEVSSIIRSISDDSGYYTTKSTPMGGDENTADFAETTLNDKNLYLDFGFYSYNIVSGGKLFVMGTSDIIDPDCLPNYSIASSTLAIFANTWLYDSNVDMGIGNKANAYDTMVFKNAKEAKRVMALTAILPVSILIFGVLVWLKRRYA